MISGAHSIIYSTNAEADRAFLKDVIGLKSIDAGDGWLIFGLPPSELAIHPAEKNDKHQFYFICDNVQTLVAGFEKRGVACTKPEDHGWGIMTLVTLPGGGQVGMYEPRHPRP